MTTCIGNTHIWIIFYVNLCTPIFILFKFVIPVCCWNILLTVEHTPFIFFLVFGCCSIWTLQPPMSRFFCMLSHYYFLKFIYLFVFMAPINCCCVDYGYIYFTFDCILTLVLCNLNWFFFFGVWVWSVFTFEFWTHTILFTYIACKKKTPITWIYKYVILCTLCIKQHLTWMPL